MHWNTKAGKEGRRLKVFCASMADICEDHEQLMPWRTRLIELIQHTRNIDWLLLTKRPENYLPMFGEDFFLSSPHAWPGFTAENQDLLDMRIGSMWKIPGHGHKWISAEPLLGPLDFEPSGALWPLCRSSEEDHIHNHDGGMWCDEPSIDWVVVGGESGDRFRDPGIEPILNIVDQCKETETACFVKQDAGRFPGQQGRIPNEYWQVKEFPNNH